MAESRICSIPDCGKFAKTKGWCMMHYTRWRRHGDPLSDFTPRPMPLGTCSVEGCDNTVKAKGGQARQLCGSHLARFKRHGDASRGGTMQGARRTFLETVVFSHRSDDCLIWPYTKVRGYGQVISGGKTRLVHRVVCERVHGPAPSPIHHAAHICGNGCRGCVSPRHLAWKTPQENEADKLRHGTAIRGMRHPKSKLTPAVVKEIRALEGSESCRKIATKFGVSDTLVSKIHKRQNWGWLD